MFSLLLGFALSTAPDSSATEAARSVVPCTASRLKNFVSPAGVGPAWPTTGQLPASLGDSLGVLLSDQGHFADGYSYWLLVDEGAASAYVVQRGGFAGTQTVYGPLPVASCPEVPPNNSFKPKPLRGSA